MQKLIQKITLLSFLLLSFQSLSYDISPGETIRMNSDRYVRIKDSESSCQLRLLGILKVIKEENMEDVLIEYDPYLPLTPGDCLIGTRAVIPKHHFDTFRSEYGEYLVKKSNITKILNGEGVAKFGDYHRGMVLTSTQWFWAVVEEKIGKFHETSLCRMLDGTEVEVLGFWTEKKQMLLINLTDQGAGYCPKGALFFNPVK